MDLKEISRIISESTKTISEEDRQVVRKTFDLLIGGLEELAQNQARPVRAAEPVVKSGPGPAPVEEEKPVSSMFTEPEIKIEVKAEPDPVVEVKLSAPASGRPKEDLLKDLYDCVVYFEDDRVIDVAEEYIAAGYDPYEGIEGGLVAGMNRVAELYDEGEYFITDLLLCSDAMYAGLDVLKVHIAQDEEGNGKTAVLGVVEGDTHDIGKNLVKIMMETAGFNIIDLGRDVPLSQFVEAAVESDADLVCMSTLMTTTMGGMETVVQHLEEAGIRDKVKVMVGGGSITQKFSDDIGADAYTRNAVEAVKKAKELVGIA